MESYRNYIESSMAEWSVAKHGYVLGRRAGSVVGPPATWLLADLWLSRIPALPQSSGRDGHLPFQTIEEAATAIREVEGNYTRHARAARAIAEEYFDSSKVSPD
jgi:hypothetical protein